jgi:hypothetical protein
VDFEEVVAGVNGTVGRFRTQVTSTTRGSRAQHGECQQHGTLETREPRLMIATFFAERFR